MSYFIRNGNTFRVADNNSVDIRDHLPAGNFIVKEDAFGNLFLEQIEQFKEMTKLYGDTVKNSGRIINTFLDRPGRATGVMLAGEKGSGKSLLAKQLSIDCAKMNIPTIVINEAWVGDKFNKFLQDIDQPCVVLMDEFEKTYDSDEQEQALTLLDGVYPTQKLFVLTCNDKWRIDRHMRNRPGRLYYMLDFRGLDADFIREYCTDNLNNKTHIEKIVTVGSLFGEFNFDMLKALVEEMNRYNETPTEALKMLNAKPEYDTDHRYEIKLWRKDGIELSVHHPRQWEGNPMQLGVNGHDDEICLYFNPPKTAKKTKDSDPALVTLEIDEDESHRANFRGDDLVKVLPGKGEFEFFNREGYRLILTRVVEKTTFHFDAF